jgi:hypothetical protein
MKVIKRYNQHRRDLSIDMECENCSEKQTYDGAYDDANFWQNVVPNFDCPKCGKSTKDLGLEPEGTHTRYPEGYQI